MAIDMIVGMVKPQHNLRHILDTTTVVTLFIQHRLLHTAAPLPLKQPFRNVVAERLRRVGVSRARREPSSGSGGSRHNSVELVHLAVSVLMTVTMRMAMMVMTTLTANMSMSGARMEKRNHNGLDTRISSTGQMMQEHQEPRGGHLQYSECMRTRRPRASSQSPPLDAARNSPASSAQACAIGAGRSACRHTTVRSPFDCSTRYFS